MDRNTKHIISDLCNTTVVRLGVSTVVSLWCVRVSQYSGMFLWLRTVMCLWCIRVSLDCRHSGETEELICGVWGVSGREERCVRGRLERFGSLTLYTTGRCEDLLMWAHSIRSFVFLFVILVLVHQFWGEACRLQMLIISLPQDDTIKITSWTQTTRRNSKVSTGSVWFYHCCL